MKTYRFAIPFALAALAACGGGGDDAETKAPADSVTSTTAAPMPGADSAGAAAPGGDTSHTSASNPTIQMAAIGNSGISGQAQLMEHGANQTMVTVTLNGAGSNTHPGHIHTGTCDNLGAVVAPLQSVQRANGPGTSTSTVEVPIATVMNGQHVVNFHAGAGDNPMAPVACGQIPAQGGGGTTQAM